eukprot:PhM_4_TR8918/c0_g1_i1/m.6336
MHWTPRALVLLPSGEDGLELGTAVLNHVSKDKTVVVDDARHLCEGRAQMLKMCLLMALGSASEQPVDTQRRRTRDERREHKRARDDRDHRQCGADRQRNTSLVPVKKRPLAVALLYEFERIAVDVLHPFLERRVVELHDAARHIAPLLVRHGVAQNQEPHEVVVPVGHGEGRAKQLELELRKDVRNFDDADKHTKAPRRQPPERDPGLGGRVQTAVRHGQRQHLWGWRPLLLVIVVVERRHRCRLFRWKGLCVERDDVDEFLAECPALLRAARRDVPEDEVRHCEPQRGLIKRWHAVGQVEVAQELKHRDGGLLLPQPHPAAATHCLSHRQDGLECTEGTESMS